MAVAYLHPIRLELLPVTVHGKVGGVALAEAGALGLEEDLERAGVISHALAQDGQLAEATLTNTPQANG